MTTRQNSPNLWHALDDWFECMPVALKVMLHEPLLLGGALVCIVLLIILPLGPKQAQYAGEAVLAELAYHFFMIALSCKAIWRQDSLITDGETDDSMQWGAVARAFVCVVFYSIASTIGMGFFIIPGIVFAVRTALYPVVICLEDRGVVSCFTRSVDLTAERFWRTFTYMVGPSAVIFIAECVIPLVLPKIAPNAFHDTTANIGWILEYPFIAVILILSSLVALFAQVSAMPLFTKLYVEYAEEEHHAEEFT